VVSPDASLGERSLGQFAATEIDRTETNEPTSRIEVVADAAVESAGLIGFLFESWDALATNEPISRQFSMSGNEIHYDIERTMLPPHYAWSDRAIHANAQTASRDFRITSPSTARHRGTKMVNARRSLELSLTNVSGLPSRNGAERGLRGASRPCRLPQKRNRRG